MTNSCSLKFFMKGALGLAAPSKNHAANVADGSKTDIDGLGDDVRKVPSATERGAAKRPLLAPRGRSAVGFFASRKLPEHPRLVGCVHGGTASHDAALPMRTVLIAR